MLSTLPSLRHLDLLNTPIDSPGIAVLLSLPKVQRLVLGSRSHPLPAHLAEQLRAQHGRNVLA